jgi:integrase
LNNKRIEEGTDLMASKAPFTLCRVKNKERFSYYVMYRDPNTQKRLTKKSIDRLKSKLNLGYEIVTRREEATIIAQRALDEGIIFNSTKKLTLAQFLMEFYDLDRSEYFKRKLMLDSHSVSPDYIATRCNLIKNHVLPLIETDFELSRINLDKLESIQTQLVQKKKLSSTTINQIMGSISLALEFAKKKNYILQSTATKVDSIKAKGKTRGILTQEETTELMRYLKGLSNRRIYLSCYLSLVTGMRSGEIRALNTNNIKDALINVDVAYANIAGFKEPKGKKSRIVPCPNELLDQLKNFALSNPYRSKEDGLVFWSARGGSVVSSHYFNTKFKESLVKSNILTERNIEERNISFHSLRHMANTLLRGSVDEYILRLTIGHSSEQISDIYSHIEETALKTLRSAQEKNILPLIGGKD